MVGNQETGCPSAARIGGQEMRPVCSASGCTDVTVGGEVIYRIVVVIGNVVERMFMAHGNRCHMGPREHHLYGRHIHIVGNSSSVGNHVERKELHPKVGREDGCHGSGLQCQK